MRQQALEQRSPAHFVDLMQILREQQRLATLLAAQQVLDVGVVPLAGQHQQVAAVIVRRVPVAVVDNLAGQQGAPQEFLCEAAVQQEAAARLPIPDLSVLFPFCASCPPLGVIGRASAVNQQLDPPTD